ncbi:MAG: CBS domain-containing protein, partial [Candidatus Margulisiibacteriota bacterium]
MQSLAAKGIFVSELLGMILWSADNKKTGKLKDIVVDISATFPRVTGFIIDVPLNKNTVYLPLDQKLQINKDAIKISIPYSEIKYVEEPSGSLHLKQSVMDRQIVDVNNLKIMRVNDIKLIKAEDGFRFVAVACGISGILRRLKLLKIAKKIPLIGSKIPEKLISWSNVQQLKTDVDELRLKVTYEKIFNLHEADIAEILSIVHHEERSSIIESLNVETIAEVLPYLDDQIKANIIEYMHLDRAVDVIGEMSTDDAVDILGDVSDRKGKEILEKLEPEDIEDFQELLKHKDDTAGGLMNTDFVAFQPEITVAAALNKLRELKPDEEMFYYIYVVDKKEHLLGVFSLQEMVLASPLQKLSEIMEGKVVTVEVSADTEEIGELVSKYNLLALPVIDADNTLLGVITVDDVV